MFEDTIAANATSQVDAAVHMIRISGEDALDIASKLIGKDLNSVPGYTVHYGTVRDQNGEMVDDVLVSVFHGPKSYTGEDVAEISCHGGSYVTSALLQLIFSYGARMARNGEFTERAYLNGKMDLSSAEAVNDLINAKDRINARSAVHSLRGSVQKILDPLVEDLTQIISNIEVNIDYPEYEDVHQLTEEEILPAAEKWVSDISTLIETAQQAVMIRSGIDTVILGKPNVGKSSLLNALLEEDKAIVTDIAGTTRDIVEGTVRIGDVTLNLIDTAGIHETGDAIEQMGIDRSMKALEKAQLVILVLDASEEIDEEDQKLLSLTEGKTRIVVYNKKDQAGEVKGSVSVSALNKDIDSLKEAVEEIYRKELVSASMDTLNNDRQIGCALSARQSMMDAVQALKDGMELDLVTIDLQKAWTSLKEITGETHREDLLDQIFSRFCLGK